MKTTEQVKWQKNQEKLLNVPTNTEALKLMDLEEAEPGNFSSEHERHFKIKGGR